MNSSSSPRRTNRYVWHRLLSEGMLSTLQLNSQPSTFPERCNKSWPELPTNLLNFRKIRNYIPPDSETSPIYFPPMKSISASVLRQMMWTDTILPGLTAGVGGGGWAYETAWQVSGQSAGQTLQKSAVGLKGDVGGHAGSERRRRRGALFIMADCLSVWFPASIHCSYPHPHTPLIGFPSLPIRV